MTGSVRAAWTRLDLPTAIAISVVVQTMISLFAASIPVLAPEIAADRGWNANVIAFYPMVVFGVAFLISFRIPGLLVRMGGMGLGLACVGISAMALLILLSPYALAAALAAAAVGCATGAMNPASSQVLGQRTTARTAGLIMSIKQTGVPLGGVVAGALVPVLAVRYGWRVAAIVLAIMGATMVLVLLPTVRWLNGSAPAKPVVYRPLDPLKHLLALPGMPPLLLASLTFNGMQSCLRSFFIVFLVHHKILDLAAAGIAFSVSQVAGMVGMVGWAAMSDRVSVRGVMAVIGVLMTAASFLVATITPQWSFAGIILVAAMLGLSSAGYLPVLLGEVARRSPPGQAGALTSGALLFPMTGAGAGPLAFGAIASGLDMPAAFMAAAASTLLGTIALALPHQLFTRLSVAREQSSG